MSNPRKLSEQNGGEVGDGKQKRVESCDGGGGLAQCSAFTDEATDTPNEREDNTADSHNEVSWMESKETYDCDISDNPEISVGEVMVDGLCKGLEVPEFDRPGAIEEGSSSSEWIMTVDTFGQILLEIPESRPDCFDVESTNVDVHCRAEMEKEVKGLGDLLESETSASTTVFDVASSDGLLKENLIDLGSENLIQDSVTFDNSSDINLLKNNCQQNFNFENQEILHGDDVVPHKFVARNDTNERNYLTISEHSTLLNEPFPVEKGEAPVSSTLSLQTVTFKNILPVSSEQEVAQSYSEEMLSIIDFRNVLNVNSATVKNICEAIDVHTTNENDRHMDSSGSASVSDNITPCVSSSRSSNNVSVMDLLLETSTLDKTDTSGEIIPLTLSSDNGEALVTTLENRFPLTSSRGNDTGQIKGQESSNDSILSFLSGATTRDSAVVTKPASKQFAKHSKDDSKRSFSKSSLKVFKCSASSLANEEDDSVPKSKIIILKGSAANQGFDDVPDYGKDDLSCEEFDDDHAEAKKFMCSQEGCDWSFATAYKLKRHEESHEGRKDYICTVEGCCRKFTTIYNLKTHMKLHALPCTEICPHPNCAETFRNKRLLDKHMKIHSNGEKTYKCPHPGCTKTFFSQTSIGSHARVHQHDSELICAFDGCGRKFDKLCRLKQHMRSHTGERPYKCTVEGCNWAFSTSSKLCRHLQMHEGQKKWQCPFEGCNKLFTRAEHARGHLITHSNLRPFACTVEGCEAKFKSKNSLEIHLKRHKQMDKKTKGVVFYCPHEDCSQKFSTKAQLRMHLEEHSDAMMNDPQSGGIMVSAQVGLFPMMISLELENIDNVFQSQRASSASVPVDASFLSSSTSASASNLMTSENSLFLGQQSAVICSTPTTLNLLTLPVLVQSEPATCKSVSSTTAASRSSKADFLSYHIIEQSTKGKHQSQSDSISSTSLLSVGQVNDTPVLSGHLHCLPKENEPNVMLNTDEIMTSHAITFRDPETGTIYVQTQLLQDDPPNTDLYLDNNDDTGSSLDLDTTEHPAMITSELTGLLHDDFNNDEAHEVEFTGTTINLQDLE